MPSPWPLCMPARIHPLMKSSCCSFCHLAIGKESEIEMEAPRKQAVNCETEWMKIISKQWEWEHWEQLTRMPPCTSGCLRCSQPASSAGSASTSLHSALHLYISRRSENPSRVHSVSFMEGLRARTIHAYSKSGGWPSLISEGGMENILHSKRILSMSVSYQSP